MKTYKVEIEGEEINFRLRSEDCVVLEKENNQPLVKYVQNESVTMCINLLQYMRKFENPNFSRKNAEELYDKFINAGWTYKQIIQDVIYETLVVSGFLTKEEWEEIKETTKQVAEKMKKQKEDILATA